LVYYRLLIKGTPRAGDVIEKKIILKKKLPY